MPRGLCKTIHSFFFTFPCKIRGCIKNTCLMFKLKKIYFFVCIQEEKLNVVLTLQVVAPRLIVHQRTGASGKAQSKRGLVPSKNGQENTPSQLSTNHMSMSVPVYLKSAHKPLNRRVQCVSRDNSLLVLNFVKYTHNLTSRMSRRRAHVHVPCMNGINRQRRNACVNCAEQAFSFNMVIIVLPIKMLFGYRSAKSPGFISNSSSTFLAIR